MSLSHRLRKHADYQHAYAASRKQFTHDVAYFFAPRPPERRSDTSGPRVGLTVLAGFLVLDDVDAHLVEALGKAHDRNRIKRRMRVAVAANLPLLSGPIDVILHPRRSVLTLEFTALSREIAMVFRAVQSGMKRGVPPRRPARPSASLPVPAQR